MSDSGLASPYPQDQSAMVQYLMSIDPSLAGSIAPMMSPMTQGMLAGLAPRADQIGKTGATNYAQDLLSLNFDDALAAYGGAGAYAEGAFNPVTTSNIVDTPGRRRLLQAMQLGTSIDSTIARVLMDGGAPGDARGEVNKLVQEAVAAGANATPEQQQLLSQLPRSSDPLAEEGTMSVYDMDSIYAQIEDLNDMAMSDPPEGSFAPIIGPNGEMIRPGGERRWVDDGNGGEVLVEYSSEPSEVAQQYIDQGLSLPTDEYTAEGLLGSDWQEQAGALAGSRDVQNAASRNMRMNQQDPMLAARQSEMNEIPYGGPVNDAIPSSAGGLRADPATINPYESGVQGSYSAPEQFPTGSISGGPGTNVLTPENVMNGTYVPAGNMTDEALQTSVYDTHLGDPLRRLQEALAEPAPQDEDFWSMALAPALGTAGGGQAPQTAAQPDLQQLLAILGQQPGVQAAAQDPNAVPDVYQSAQNGPMDRLNAELGTNYGGGRGESRQIMPQNKMLGGTGPDPEPGTPEWWAAQQNGGYNVPGQAPTNPNVSGPPPPQPPTTAPGMVTTPDFYAYQGGYSPEGPQQPSGNQQMGPIPGSPEWLAMQSQGFQGWPTATDALSYQNNQRHLNYPDQPEYNALSGGSANAGSLPQGGGVLGIGDYLNQYVMGGGTQPHAGAPEQPEYNPLPQTSQRGRVASPNASDIVSPRDQASWLGQDQPLPAPSDSNTRAQGGQAAQPTAQMIQAILGQQPQSRRGEMNMNDVLAMGPPSTSGPMPALNTTDLANVFNGSSSGGSGTSASRATSQALWDTLFSQSQQQTSAPTYDPLSSANAGSKDEEQQTAGTGRRSQTSDELREYNEGVGERAGKARRKAQRNLGYRQEDVDAWKAAVEQGNRERSYYGAEYGRAAGLAYLMKRAGIRPLDRELAARGAVASGMGLRPS